MITLLINQNDIYLYFETIRQLQAKSVLDIGLTLKRCGAISRQVADSAIDPAVHLCGIDLDPETTTPVYQCLYQELLSPEEFIQKGTAQDHYDLAVLLNLPEEILADQKLLRCIHDHASFLLSDRDADQFLLTRYSHESVQTITLDHNQYLLMKKAQGEGKL